MSSVDESINREVDIPFQMLHEKIFKVLTQSIYPSPNISVIRELVRNGIDSITTKNPVGNDGQITVTIDVENCVIVVEDNGKGLSPDDVKRVYCSIGQTTKSHDSSLGIGSKSPLLMADTYLVQTWAEGSEPIAFTATSKGVKFLEPSTVTPIAHHGTRVLVPFDPSKVDISNLADEARRIFAFAQTPIYLDQSGRKELISTRSFDSIDFLSDKTTLHVDRLPDKDRPSLFGSALRWDSQDWTTILLLNQDGHLRRYYDSLPNNPWLHLFVDGLPLRYSKSLMEETHFFPACAKVLVNIKNRSLIDIAADRENLLENEKCLSILTTIQKTTEEPVVTSILSLPEDPYQLLTWNRDHRDEEQKTTLLDQLVSASTNRENPDDPMRLYTTRVTGWAAKELLLATKLLSLSVHVFEGKNKPIPWTDETSNYRPNLIRVSRDAYKNETPVYAHRDTRCKRILPKGSLLLTPRRRNPRDETVTHMRRLGIKTVDALPEARSTSNPIIYHGIEYNKESTVIVKIHKKTSIASLTKTIIVPSASRLRAVTAATRTYLTDTRFAVTPRNRGDRDSLNRRKLHGVQKLEEYLRADTPVTFMRRRCMLNEACSQWQSQFYRKTRATTRIMFPVPNGAKDILPTSLWTREFNSSRTVLVDFIFVRNNNDLPRALIHIASVLQHLEGFTFSTQFIEGLFRSIVTSKTVSELMIKYYHARPCRRKRRTPYSRWKHFLIFDTRNAIFKHTPRRRVRRSGSRDGYRYVKNDTRAQLYFSRKILKDMQLAFKVLLLLLSNDQHLRELLFTTLSALKIENYTPYLRDISKIILGIEQVAARMR